METAELKIGSSPTLKGVEKLINGFFFSTSYKVSKDFVITNSKGVYENGVVKKEGKRFVFYVLILSKYAK